MYVLYKRCALVADTQLAARNAVASWVLLSFDPALLQECLARVASRFVSGAAFHMPRPFVTEACPGVFKATAKASQSDLTRSNLCGVSINPKHAKVEKSFRRAVLQPA